MQRRLLLVLAICWFFMHGTVRPAVAEFVFFDEFQSYAAGWSIHLQGDVDGTPKWFAQRNSSMLGDHGWSTVTESLDPCLRMINRDYGDELDIVFTAAYLGEELSIDDQGTIFLMFKADGPSDTILSTNDLEPGWDYDSGSALTPGFQGLGQQEDYESQASLVELSGGEMFHARNGDHYDTVYPSRLVDQWYKLWIQIDIPMKRARYYIAEDDGSPQLVLNADGGEWWGFRNAEVQAIRNLKFFVMGAFPTNTWVETSIWIDSVAIDPSLLSIEDPTMPRFSWQYGDADRDLDVDLDDFVILRNQFGSSSSNCYRLEADFNEDGAVDFGDFVILKENFGRDDFLY